MRDPELTMAIEETEDTARRIKDCIIELSKLESLATVTKIVGGNILKKELEKWINTIADLKAMEKETQIEKSI